MDHTEVLLNMSNLKKRKRRTDQYDATIGARLRIFRQMKGMSQSEVAGKIGVTFQQLQKYEHAINRVSASTLYRLSQTLGVPVTEFFTGLDGILKKEKAKVFKKEKRGGYF